MLSFQMKNSLDAGIQDSSTSISIVVKFEEMSHSGPKTPKSKPGGESPNFIWQMKEGYIGISKYKIFFKSVEGNF